MKPPGLQWTLQGLPAPPATAAPAVSQRIAFYVPGEPMAKGDHTAQTIGGRTFIREKNAGRKASWRQLAKHEAELARGDRGAALGPVRVTLEVLRMRPAGHFGSGRNAGVLKGSAPLYPTSKPDLDKLQRSLGDALNGVLWRDDAQITTWVVTRRWADRAGIRVTVEPESGS